MNLLKNGNLALAEKTTEICGKIIKYTLFMKRKGRQRFFIRVAYDKEILKKFLSNDIEKATRFFNMIARNKVTPCTLDDIICDFNYRVELAKIDKNKKSYLLF